MLEWLENWYESQCDGNWEHDYGVKIENIDNPGWSITININEIIEKVTLNKIDWTIIGDFESKWVGFMLSDDIFKASGSSKNLSILIYIFKQIVENKNINHDEINQMIK